ncbi:Phosphoribosyl 1,2-cyclic phosphodiesterase [Lignipirellula cremea]|uniref:Phosphoribosyl 1,2-cyclic phosphodiesterase n=2 Tax=Lignipirellula cremea TaxID=2528010 RepID=A0A518DUN9_9BACT|nr:Phosphoribosyl 1,2-cyclic phosphodiesterase [Lignipirellula cremea]
MILLGTGTSVGVPAIGCGCPVCTSDNPRNNRTRCAVALGLPEGNLLIDTPPDLRVQLLREKIGIIHAVAFTHEHADHIMGLDDLRLFPFYLQHPVPLYCEPKVESRLRQSFDYAFMQREQTHVGAAPQLTFHTIGLEPFDLLGETIIPLRLKHGPRFEVLGFRIGNVAYCTDASEIPPETLERMQGLDVLIIDALRAEPHVTHLSVGQAVAIAQELAPRQTYLTHTSHELDYDRTNQELPAGIDMAYDGQSIPLSKSPLLHG